jgi:Phage Tail Protein X.
MWDSIAYRQLGSTAHTDKLMTLNAEYLDYYIFPAGIVLRLPEVSAEPSGKLPPWKKVLG